MLANTGILAKKISHLSMLKEATAIQGFCALQQNPF